MNAERSVYIALGSNIEPQENLAQAVQRLAQQVEVTGISTIYRTPPIGRTDQPEYLNGVVSVKTDMGLRDLKYEVLRPIEEALGRVRTTDRYAARTIDLDIIYAGDELVKDRDLTVPDEDLPRRPFMALALYELAPNAVLPHTGESLAELTAVMDYESLEQSADLAQHLRSLLNT